MAHLQNCLHNESENPSWEQCAHFLNSWEAGARPALGPLDSHIQINLRSHSFWFTVRPAFFHRIFHFRQRAWCYPLWCASSWCCQASVLATLTGRNDTLFELVFLVSAMLGIFISSSRCQFQSLLQLASSICFHNFSVIFLNDSCFCLYFWCLGQYSVVKSFKAFGLCAPTGQKFLTIHSYVCFKIMYMYCCQPLSYISKP